MRLRLLAAIGVAGLTGPTALEAQHVRGAVLDASTRSSVAEAELVLMGSGRDDVTRATSDSTGRFLIALPRAGLYRVTVSHAAYVPYVSDSIRIGTGEVVTLQIRLGQTAVPLEPLLVTARRNNVMDGFDERVRAGFGQFLTRDQIASRRAARTTDLLRGLTGVTLRRVGSSGSMIYVRGGGGRDCQPAIWLDGLEIRQFPGSTMDDILAPNTIEAIEVYASSSAAPTPYASGPCGVVLFWTRHGSGDDGQPWRWKRILAGVGAAALVFLLFR